MVGTQIRVRKLLIIDEDDDAGETGEEDAFVEFETFGDDVVTEILALFVRLFVEDVVVEEKDEVDDVLILEEFLRFLEECLGWNDEDDKVVDRGERGMTKLSQSLSVFVTGTWVRQIFQNGEHEEFPRQVPASRDDLYPEQQSPDSSRPSSLL